MFWFAFFSFLQQCWTSIVTAPTLSFSTQDLGWDVATDSFWSATPIGEIPFSNIIASLPAEAEEGSYLPPRRLALACHYDSKQLNDDGWEKVGERGWVKDGGRRLRLLREGGNRGGVEAESRTV